MASEVDGLVSVVIRRGVGRRTKVSLDGLLFEWLSHRYGGVLGAEGWIRRAAHRVEVLQDAGDPTVNIGHSGFSRLVQRMIVLDLIEAAGGLGRALVEGRASQQTALVEALKEMDGEDGFGGDSGPGMSGGEVVKVSDASRERWS